ncbi:MAG: UvrABC system protein A [Planctomycetes bacterium]|nr:UvrABC system protein A [Planctomycetota bacterium]
MTREADRTRERATEPPIRLRGVRQHNLRGVDVDFPYDRMTVVTGVSGSGKSSLVFDTLYAEGQRRYVESFSAYARQFLERMPRPRADAIDDLPPAVAVEQANPVRTTRSTVGTMTELTDHLKLLFAKAATLHCPGCGRAVVEEGPSHVADHVAALPDGTRLLVTFPWPPAGGLPFDEQVRGLAAAGFVRVVDGSGRATDLATLRDPADDEPRPEIVADRFVAGRVERSRVLEAAEAALRHGRGRCAVRPADGSGGGASGAGTGGVASPPAARAFSSSLHCAACDRAFKPATANLFSFNSPLGACPTCRGFGRTVEPDLRALVPDPRKSLTEGAIRPWTTPRTRPERRELEAFCRRSGIDMLRPWDHLPERHRKAILEGTPDFFGIAGWMKWLETKSYKMHVRVLLARYRAYVPCTVCGGTRRRPEALHWKVAGRDVHGWETIPLADALAALRSLDAPGALAPQAAALSQIVREAVEARLSYLVEVGLGYLTMDRATRTLSGGEFQRVNLATALGAALVNTLYVLDEPSIGLHPRDTGRLLSILAKLRDRGNTLVVVEHDPDTIAAADHVVDLGPGAGERGGRVLFQGTLDALRADPASVTARFLRGEESASPRRDARRDPRGFLVLRGARGHNLRGVDFRVPVGVMTAVCGVSGSGKSSLVLGTLLPALQAKFGKPGDDPLPHDRIDGSERFGGVVLVDQSPIGRTPRSNPVTYTNAMAHIRTLLGTSDDARRMGLGPKHFSFNSRGGRCPKCDGAGAELLEMQFLADVFVPCAECEGKRFKPDVLEVRLKGRNVHEILEMTVDESLGFFAGPTVVEQKVRDALDPLVHVGLGYLRLGQSATTLSGGEAQRLKLAAHLPRSARESKRAHLFLFDEPTTGLHLSDVRTLVTCMQRIVDAGHTVVVIEHHMAVAAAADWIVELGPEGGAGGGAIVAAGAPETVAAGATLTAPFLVRELAMRGRGRRA